MKAISWPLMDDPDALPSSYVAKVLGCLSKWRVKMQELNDVLLNMEEGNDALKQSFGCCMRANARFTPCKSPLPPVLTEAVRAF